MKNKTGSFIKVMGKIIMWVSVGILALSIMAVCFDNYQTGRAPAMDSIMIFASISSIILGIGLMGLGEAIKLLQEISNSVKK